MPLLLPSSVPGCLTPFVCGVALRPSACWIYAHRVAACWIDICVWIDIRRRAHAYLRGVGSGAAGGSFEDTTPARRPLRSLEANEVGDAQFEVPQVAVAAGGDFLGPVTVWNGACDRMERRL